MANWPVLLDQVGGGVADGHQGCGELLMGDLVARAHHDRLQVAEALDDRLQQRPDRGDHEVQRTDRLVGRVRVRQPTQDGQAPTDRVRARAQALVREGLPCREHGHSGGSCQAAGSRREVLGLAGGSRDGQDEAVPGHPGGEERDRGIGGDHRARRPSAREARAKAGSSSSPAQKSREVHESPHSPTPGRPPSAASHASLANPPVSFKPSRPVWEGV